MNGVEIHGSSLDVTIRGITFTRQPGNTYATSYPLRIAETSSTFTSLVLKDVEVAHAHAANVHLGGAGTFESITIENSSFHHAGTWGFLASGQINSMTVTDSDFEHNGQVDASHGIGFDLAGPGPFTNITVIGGSFSHNKHTGLGMAQASNVTIKNVVASYNGGHPGAGFGVRIDEWQGKTQNVLIENATASYNVLDGIAIQPEKEDAIENVTIRGATLSENGRHGLNLVYIYTGSNNPEMTDVKIEFSNIYANGGSGVRVWSWWVDMEITEVFDATHNWWGANDGPGGAGPGSGDAVSANVDYDPWLTAAVAGAKSGAIPPLDELDATTEADTVVIVTGSATVTVARYEDNPGTGFSGDIGKYIDVHIEPTDGVTEVEIRLYYTNREIRGLAESSLRLYWWDGLEWVQCSDSGVNTTDTDDYSGYIWAKIRGDTTPSLDDLTGTPFCGGGSPRIVGGTVYSVDKVSILMPWIGLAAAMALAGVFVTRLARRKVRS